MVRNQDMDVALAKKAITKHEIISFDLFDTLVVRPYVKPTDLFKHIEADIGLSGFFEERVRAEKACRVKSTEITFDEIYENIDERFRNLKDMELDYERSLIRVNPEILEIYRYALENNKTVIIMTDMYLPSGFLEEILQKTGYSGYSRLFVSGEYRHNKVSGELFNIVIEELGIDKRSMLHVGDNRTSDYLVPTKMGIDSIHYESPMSQYISAHRKEFNMYNKEKDLGMSIILAVDAIKWKNDGRKDSADNYWYDISYRFGGPIVYSYIHFINENITDNCEKIMFVARDGYNLIRLYRSLYGDSHEYEYIYAPRIFRFLKKPENASKFYSFWIVRSFSDYDSVRELVPKRRTSVRECHKIYKDNVNAFEKIRLDEMENYNNYVKTIAGGCHNVSIVDVTTMRFSSQKLLESFVDEDCKVVGCYYIKLCRNTEEKHRAFHDRSGKFNNWSDVNIPEFFMSSPDPPIKGLNSDYTPIFKKNNQECELWRISLQDDVLRGETDYISDLKTIFGDKLPKISSKAVERWTRVLINRKSKLDQENILMMKWAPDFDHEEYHYLTYNWRDFRYHVMSKGFGLVKKLIKSE